MVSCATINSHRFPSVGLGAQASLPAPFLFGNAAGKDVCAPSRHFPIPQLCGQAGMPTLPGYPAATAGLSTRMRRLDSISLVLATALDKETIAESTRNNRALDGN